MARPNTFLLHRADDDGTQHRRPTMTNTPPTHPATFGAESAERLDRTAAHLEGAYALACASAGSDVLSPWANTAMSIHLAAASLSRYLPEPVPAADHADCLTALRAAQTELMLLQPDHHLPQPDLALIRTRLATALAEAQSLQGTQPASPSEGLR